MGWGWNIECICWEVPKGGFEGRWTRVYRREREEERQDEEWLIAWSSWRRTAENFLLLLFAGKLHRAERGWSARARWSLSGWTSPEMGWVVSGWLIVTRGCCSLKMKLVSRMEDVKDGHESPNRGNYIKKSISKHKVQLIFVLLGASHYWEGGFEIKTRWRTPLTLRHEVGWDGQDYISWRLGCSWSRANLQFWVAANVNFRPLGFPCVFYVHIVPSVISRFNKRHGSHCIDDINQVYYINSASFFLHHSKIYVGAFRSSLWLIYSKGFPCR